MKPELLKWDLYPDTQGDPITDSPLPATGEAYREFREKLFSHSYNLIARFTTGLREPPNGQRVMPYTVGEALSIQTALAFVLMHARSLAVAGRDNRNELEKKLLERIEALEARPSLKYAGVWNDKTVYGEGNLVTDGGSMWHANRASLGTRPGADDTFQLVVKKGRDGKDAK